MTALRRLVISSGKSIRCPDCEEGTLRYQPEEWEGGERPALQYPELYFCNECGVTHTPEEMRERFL